MTSVASMLTSSARWFLVLVFAWSAGAKAFWPQDFQTTLLATGMIYDWAAPAIAVVLPPAEASIAFCLAVGRGGPAPLFATVTLSLLFVFVHGYVIAIGSVLPCGCAGIIISHASTGSHVGMLLISLGMLAAACLLLFLPVRIPQICGMRDMDTTDVVSPVRPIPARNPQSRS